MYFEEDWFVFGVEGGMFMLRISYYLCSFVEDVLMLCCVGGRCVLVVIWNLLWCCNLICKYCYFIFVDSDFCGELEIVEIFCGIDDLCVVGVCVLIFFGGELLMYLDFFEIVVYVC